MRWDERELDMRLPAKARMPTPDTTIPNGRRFRLPEVQAEVERRIAIYTSQVEQQGYINWLPHKGDGEGA